MNTKFNEITKNVINIYDDIPHPNQKCQDIKEEWMKFCFQKKYGINNFCDPKLKKL